jgi:hypothetical protein
MHFPMAAYPHHVTAKFIFEARIEPFDHRAPFIMLRAVRFQFARALLATPFDVIDNGDMSG